MTERIIQAAIVNHERNRVVLDQDGRLPEMPFTPEHGTHEGTLNELGRRTLANVPYVSVDHRHVVDGVQLYQTKPVPETAEPVDPYRWAAVPSDIELK